MPFEPPRLKSGIFGTRGPGPVAMQPVANMGPSIPPPKGPKGLRVEDRIGVQAPAHVVWEVVRDLDRWHEWNPTYPKASGVLRIGELITVTLALPGQAPQELKPRVLEWVPDEQLHWRLSLLGGLIKTIRYIEIEALAEASCVVDNGEIFGGFMGPSMGKRMGRTVQRGFKAMNEALKARAEAAWKAQQG
jgi:hypothetical protein